MREFVIHGEGEVADIAELCLSRAAWSDLSYRRENGNPPIDDVPRRVVLQCSMEPLSVGYVGISVLERLVQGAGQGIADFGLRNAEGK